MNYKVGLYNIDSGEKPFKSNDEAVVYIQKRHPELLKDEIVKYITPKIEGDGKLNKSVNVSEKNTESEDSGTEDNRRGVSKNETRRDKQG